LLHRCAGREMVQGKRPLNDKRGVALEQIEESRFPRHNGLDQSQVLSPVAAPELLKSVMAAGRDNSGTAPFHFCDSGYSSASSE